MHANDVQKLVEQNERGQHLHIVGPVSSGKTYFLKNLHKALKADSVQIPLHRSRSRGQHRDEWYSKMLEKEKEHNSRGRATIEAEHFSTLVYTRGKIVPIEVWAPGGHKSSPIPEQQANSIIYLIDADFAIYPVERSIVRVRTKDPALPEGREYLTFEFCNERMSIFDTGSSWEPIRRINEGTATDIDISRLEHFLKKDTSLSKGEVEKIYFGLADFGYPFPPPFSSSYERKYHHELIHVILDSVIETKQFIDNFKGPKALVLRKGNSTKELTLEHLSSLESAIESKMDLYGLVRHAYGTERTPSMFKVVGDRNAFVGSTAIDTTNPKDHPLMISLVQRVLAHAFNDPGLKMVVYGKDAVSPQSVHYKTL